MRRLRLERICHFQRRRRGESALGHQRGQGNGPDAHRAAAEKMAARHFAQKSREGSDKHELRNAAQMVVSEHLRARDALVNLYPEVA